MRQSATVVPAGMAQFLRCLAQEQDAELIAWAGGTPAPVAAAWAGWLRGQGLAAYACYRLRRAGALNSLSPELAQALRHAYYSAAGDAELHTCELAAVLAALAATGVTPILFKGAVLAHRVYPDPACRPMGDLDLWLTAETLPRAHAALTQAGYVEHVKDSRPPALVAGREGEVQLIGTRPGQGLVELHYGVFAGEWLFRTAAVDAAGVRCRATPVTVAGHAAWTLAAEDAVIQLAIHLAVNHQMAYQGVRTLLDICLLARSSAVDWAVVAQRARDWRVRTAVWQVLSLADRLLGLPSAAPALGALQPSPLRRRLLAHYANPDSLLAGRDLTRGPARFIYQLLLADRPRDAARLLFRALWPEPAWLAARYGRAGWRVRGAHILSVLRGRV